jgi:hypothetical protein
MVTISSFVDVLGALVAGTLHGHLYLFDNNRRSGSEGEGSDSLATAVRQGDKIVWTVSALECEAFTEIIAIDDLPSEVCEVKQHFFSGTSVSYWAGTVKSSIDRLPYSITIRLGSGLEMTCRGGPQLIKSTS